MQKTLFLYIFKDLLKVFLLASGALAGIMSFGGLLRPLTQHNLALGQVGQMLGYFMPAMTNYSWPIAALFATTFVYGRLSADNELTACRAAGLSYLHILVPAGILGTIVTLLSAFFLCYVVPHSFLKAEKVVYSNLAQLVAGQIERTQRVNLNSGQQSVTIFARAAEVLDPNPDRPLAQAVELKDVSIVSYLNDKQAELKVPAEFYLADSATAIITMPRDVEGDVSLTAILTNGNKVPRASAGNTRQLVVASIATGAYGPTPLQSPVRETAKFMDISRLLDLRAHPERSRRILKHLSELARGDQKRAFLQELTQLARAGRPLVLAGRDNDRDVTYTIEPPADGRWRVTNVGDRLSLQSGTLERPGLPFRCTSTTSPFTGRAREVLIDAAANPEEKLLYVKLEVRDATLFYQNEESPLQSKEWNVGVTMPPAVAALSERGAREYLRDVGPDAQDRVKRLNSDITRQQNQIESELHARFGFALSCFALAIVGAAIGMLFKSGNFVSAFAVSVGPALISIVLIVTGQHIAESVPKEIMPGFNNPLTMGLTVLWAGNAIVATMGLTLYLKLSRT